MTHELSEEERRDLAGRYRILRWTWHRYWDSDPDRVVGMQQEAINIAEQLNEPLWRMESRHWLAQALVFQKRDYTQTLPLAVESVVEARKPMYQNWSTRICLYQDLIAAYVGHDHVTHESKIEAALESMQAEAPPSSQCARCLLGERVSFELRRRDLEAAESAAQQLASIVRTAHHRTHAQHSLAMVAYLRQDWQSMLEFAEATEETADKATDRDQGRMSALLMQAIAHQRLGNEERKVACFQQSQAERELMHATFDPGFYDLHVDYHEFDGDLEAAIEVRREHLSKIKDKSALREEALAAIDLCRLQKRQGSVAADSVQVAQAAIAKLKVKGNVPKLLVKALAT